MLQLPAVVSILYFYDAGNSSIKLQVIAVLSLLPLFLQLLLQ